VPVGSSLSGGLDSSSIVMMIDRLKNQGIQKTFSARFPGFERDEGSFMERVISKTNVEPHFIFPSSDSSFSHLKKISYHQEAPMGTLSVAVQYEVMKLAKTNGVTVLLDGQGADETLAGYTPYWEVYFSELYRTNKTLLRSEEDAYIQLHKEKPFVRNAEFLWKAYGIDSFNKTSNLKRRFTNVHSPYFLGIHPDIVRRYRVDPNPLQKFNTLKGSLYFATMVRGLNELLSYADRNSMAHSVEVRLPFLYHELVEFIFATPNEMLLHNGWTKYLLRRSMDDILPKEIAWRTDKIGYEPPQDKWLQSKDYKDQIQASIEYLKKKNIITTECQRLTWRYLSLYAFLSAFDDS
jgi:asparagine synthase (glutamine-hydrolysing)